MFKMGNIMEKGWNGASPQFLDKINYSMFYGQGVASLDSETGTKMKDLLHKIPCRFAALICAVTSLFSFSRTSVWNSVSSDERRSFPANMNLSAISSGQVLGGIEVRGLLNQ
jgi:hypothetical protein